MKIVVILAFILFLHVNCLSGVDVSALHDLNTFQCFIKNGAQFFVVRGYREYGSIDTNAVQNLKSIKNFGVKTDIYMSNCRGRDAIAQVNQMMDGIPSNLYDTVWINVEKNFSPSCDWSSYSPTANCNYLNSLLNAVANRGKKVGIYSSVADWTYAFQTVTACPSVSSYPLWYLYADGQQSFSNFRSFGGWTQPSMKRHTTSYSWCGTENTNLDYRP